METEELYVDFKAVAKENGMSKSNIQKLIIGVYLAAWKLKLTEQEVYGVFLALESMALKKIP